MKRNLLSGLALLSFCFGANVALAQSQYVVAQQTISTGQLGRNAYDSIRNLFRKMNAGLLNDTVLLKFEYDVVPAGRQLTPESAEIIQQKVTDELRMLHSAQSVRKKISVVDIVAPTSVADLSDPYNNMSNVDTGNAIRDFLYRHGISGNSVMFLPDGRFVSLSSNDGWAVLHLTTERLQHMLSQPESLAKR